MEHILRRLDDRVSRFRLWTQMQRKVFIKRNKSPIRTKEKKIVLTTIRCGKSEKPQVTRIIQRAQQQEISRRPVSVQRRNPAPEVPARGQGSGARLKQKQSRSEVGWFRRGRNRQYVQETNTADGGMKHQQPDKKGPPSRHLYHLATRRAGLAGARCANESRCGAFSRLPPDRAEYKLL